MRQSNPINIHREITPLKQADCFMVFERSRKAFNYPIHFHPEVELNFIYKAEGAKRIVGDHIGEIGKRELVLVGSNLYHGWENDKNNKEQEFKEITIQFPASIFQEELLERNLMLPIRNMLRNADRGILFAERTIKSVESKLFALSKTQGFDGFLLFQSLLYDLAISDASECR